MKSLVSFHEKPHSLRVSLPFHSIPLESKQARLKSPPVFQNILILKN